MKEDMEIAQLSKEIEQMEQARENATKIREAEHEVYMKSKTELEETIKSIKDCITAMKEGMEGAAKYEGRGGGDATYVAKGGDVTEILKKMQMEYEDDLVALDKSEAETQAAYLLADDAKRMAIEAATKTKKTKEKVLGEKGQELANTQSDLKEATDGHLADSSVLKETITTCKKREDQYNQHMKTREGELEAMSQAIEILEKVTGVRSPESKGVSPTAVIPDFTQLRNVHSRTYKDPKAAVVAVLRKAGKSKATAALSKLADKIS